MLSTSKNEDVSQNYFVFDVVKFKNCPPRRIASFLMLSSSKTEEVSQNSFVFKLADRQIDKDSSNCNYNYKYHYTTLLLQLQIYYAILHNTNYTTLHQLHLIKLHYTNYTTTTTTKTTTTATTITTITRITTTITSTTAAATTTAATTTTAAATTTTTTTTTDTTITTTTTTTTTITPTLQYTTMHWLNCSTLQLQIQLQLQLHYITQHDATLITLHPTTAATTSTSPGGNLPQNLWTYPIAWHTACPTTPRTDAMCKSPWHTGPHGQVFGLVCYFPKGLGTFYISSWILWPHPKCQGTHGTLTNCFLSTQVLRCNSHCRNNIVNL